MHRLAAVLIVVGCGGAQVNHQSNRGEANTREPAPIPPAALVDPDAGLRAHQRLARDMCECTSSWCARGVAADWRRYQLARQRLADTGMVSTVFLPTPEQAKRMRERMARIGMPAPRAAEPDFVEAAAKARAGFTACSARFP